MEPLATWWVWRRKGGQGDCVDLHALSICQQSHAARKPLHNWTKDVRTAEGVGEKMHLKLTAEVLCDMSSARFPVLHASPGIQKMYGGQSTGDFFDAWHVDDCAIHEGGLARQSAGKIDTIVGLWPRQLNSHESYRQGFFCLMAFLMDPQTQRWHPSDYYLVVVSGAQCAGCQWCSAAPVKPTSSAVLLFSVSRTWWRWRGGPTASMKPLGHTGLLGVFNLSRSSSLQMPKWYPIQLNLKPNDFENRIP